MYSRELKLEQQICSKCEMIMDSETNIANAVAMTRTTEIEHGWKSLAWCIQVHDSTSYRASRVQFASRYQRFVVRDCE